MPGARASSSSAPGLPPWAPDLPVPGPGLPHPGLWAFLSWAPGLPVLGLPQLTEVLRGLCPLRVKHCWPHAHRASPLNPGPCPKCRAS